MSEIARSKLYLLRWRYDYTGGRSPSLGMWSNPGDVANQGAWRQNKEGVARASIEAKDYFTRETTTLAECLGEDFVNFEWLALASVNPFSLKGAGNVTPVTRLGGLVLRTRTEVVTVYNSGDISREPWEFDGVQLATFGR